MDGLVYLAVGAAGGVGIALVAEGMRRRRSRHPGPWFARAQGASADPDLVRQLSVGAVLAERNFLVTDTLGVNMSQKEAQEWLAGSWAGDRDSILFQLDSLLSDGHRRVFDHLLALDADLPQDQILAQARIDLAGWTSTADLEEFVGYLPGVRYQLLRKAGPGLRRLGTSAYDWGRAVVVARIAYTAGLLTDDEVIAYIGEASGRAAAYFDSWGAFSMSYLLGRAMWGGAGAPEFVRTRHIVARLNDAPESPWNRYGWFP